MSSGAVTQGTILLVNGKQTSCESVLLDSKAGLVAASCLQAPGNGTIDASTVYEIITRQSGDAPSARYKIEKISVHPKYDPLTFVNNLAVVQFNSGSGSNWINFIGIDPREWSTVFTRRTLASVPEMRWNTVATVAGAETPQYCDEASRAYSANKGDFLCNDADAASIIHERCRVPYGTVLAAIQPSDMAAVALHSHSAVYGDNMCSSARKLHYYTVLRNYIGWAAGVLGRPVGGFAKDPAFQFTPVKSYAMKPASAEPVAGVQMLSGDRYSQDPAGPAPSKPDTPPVAPSPPLPPTPAPAPVMPPQPPPPPPTVPSSPTDVPADPTDVPASPTDVPVSQADLFSIDPPATDSSSSSSTTSTSSSTTTPAASNSSTDAAPSSSPTEPTAASTDSTQTTTSTSSTGTRTDPVVPSNSDSLESSESSEFSNGAGGTSGSSSSSSKTGVVVAVVIVLLLLVGGGIAWFVFRRKRLAKRKANGWGRDSVASLPRGMRATQDYLPGPPSHYPEEKVESMDVTTDIINHYSQWSDSHYDRSTMMRH
ncbi:hypothetical protein IWQ57_004322 [Coemansia nantahalensis]|uniref:Uncharacterized protein n=1 Tax=Coemansia nantahalensis TaxID=2789366 RepID=A0ACC1JSQ9_9FUNG|nr:hypothetical protein IWQ57_004322 [Coemansia nantahalensis]